MRKTTLDDAVELQLKKEALEHRKKILEYNKNLYANGQKMQFYENVNQNESNQQGKLIYSNIQQPPPPPLDVNVNPYQEDEEFPPPPSPVSSSYSELRHCELRRGTDGNGSNGGYATTILPPPNNQQYHTGHPTAAQQVKNQQPYSNDYGVYGPSSQNSNYESIYEPINPRPPSQMSSRSNYSLYAPYADGLSNSNSLQRLPIINQENEVDALTNMLVQSMHQANTETDSGYGYGICGKCGGNVSEASGCTAMETIYHIACFTCHHCLQNLQGKPFYALEGKPFCEEDYLNTLEKCSVCLEPILERILRATGKPYHPNCFSCIVCGKSLDGIPFTVDATNQIHCIDDFHK